jgi:hypothetical protein
MVRRDALKGIWASDLGEYVDAIQRVPLSYIECILPTRLSGRLHMLNRPPTESHDSESNCKTKNYMHKRH